MTIRTVETRPIEGQKPGTSGLRKRTAVFAEPGYLENYVQSVIDGVGGFAGRTIVVGGDGRYFNTEAIQIILRMAAANGAAKAIVGRDGLLSTPAASCVIRKRNAFGGLILSASHNPGGPDGDFGLKFNGANGGPAPEGVTARIYEETRRIRTYRFVEADDLELGRAGPDRIGDMAVEIIDPVADHAALMESLFDFEAIGRLLETGFTLRYDAMHAVTGPYARAILETRLGAAAGSVVNAVPSPDFGGGHPDPNPVHARALFELMASEQAPDMGAASDGDGDRNVVLGRGLPIAPSDSLAVLAANAHVAPAYRDGLKGVARSMPTSRAVDAVAAGLGIPCYETPTGWKFFGNLLDAGLISICGEESAGTGSDHVREKDGLWAVLLWLNIVAARGMGVADIMRDHWRRFGRHYYTRHDYEGLDTATAEEMVAGLRARLPDLPGTAIGGLTVSAADDFSYRDPVDGSLAEHQGVRLHFEGGQRLVMRLSGTGTTGATLRIYGETCAAGPDGLDRDPATVLAPVMDAAEAATDLSSRTGRRTPDVVT